LEPGQHVVAVAALLEREGRFLCMRRAANRDAGAGLWESLSGRVEQGEAPLDAVRREIAEECGLAVELDPRPLESYPARRRNQPMVVILYRGRAPEGEVLRSEEHDEHAWLTPAEFRERSPLTLLADAMERALEIPWPAHS
jgi:8-oxo-dGTP diphosphatase